MLSTSTNFFIKHQALFRTRVLLNFKAHRLGWLKTKYLEFEKNELIITIGYSVTMEYCISNPRKLKTERGNNITKNTYVYIFFIAQH